MTRDWIRMAHERMAGMSPIEVPTPTGWKTQFLGADAAALKARAAAAQKARATGFYKAMLHNRDPQELVMLPIDWNPALMPERVMLDLKYDGIHAHYQRETGAATREGVPFEACSHLYPALQGIQDALEGLFGRPHHLFGEYVNFESFEATQADFQRGKGTGVIILFDAVSDDVYHGHMTSQPLHVRRARLGIAMKDMPAALIDGKISLAKSALFVGDARENIEVAVGELWRDGCEGAVAKDADSPYIRARSHYWMRIKQRQTMDVPILDAWAAGERSGFLVKVPGGKICRIAVGLSTAQRTSPSQFYPGRMVELRHFGITAGGSLRHASFLRFRDDKGSKS